MILEFEWYSDKSQESFQVDPCNRSAFLWLSSPQFWHGRQTLLVGPRYSGKTHLSTIWGNLNQASKLTENTELKPNTPLLVDEIEEHEEDLLLDVSNRCENLGVAVLWCTNKHPDIYNLFTNDLRTRLRSMITFEIGEPSEDLFKKIIKKRCTDIGLDINQDCIEYVSQYLELTYLAINNFIIKLNLVCLKKQRQPSICLINEIIKRD